MSRRAVLKCLKSHMKKYGILIGILFLLSVPAFPFVLVGHVIVDEWRHYGFKNAKIHPKFPPLILEPIQHSPDLDNWPQDNGSYMAMMYSGRLGNLMFQYASQIAIAKTNGMAPIVPEQFHLYDVFQIEDYVTESVFSRPGINFPKVYEKSSYIYDNRTQRLNYNLNIELLGYFQSWKYFDKIKLDILNIFQFKDSVSKAAKYILVQVKRDLKMNDNVTYIGIHVRRGDIVHSPENQQLGYVAADKTYFQRAMGYFQKKYKNIVYILCSNDMKWAKENIKSDQDNVYPIEGNVDEVDLAVLSNCNHTITSTGSFSWWAGYLSQGDVTYFRDFPRRGSPLHKQFKPADYFYPSWIGL